MKVHLVFCFGSKWVGSDDISSSSGSINSLLFYDIVYRWPFNFLFSNFGVGFDFPFGLTEVTVWWLFSFPFRQDSPKIETMSTSLVVISWCKMIRAVFCCSGRENERERSFRLQWPPKNTKPFLFFSFSKTTSTLLILVFLSFISFFFLVE